MSYRHRYRYRSFDHDRRNGWGIGLYRNPVDGWFGGVCAGLAEYWDMPTWLIRLCVFAGLLFTGALVFWLILRRGCSSVSVPLDGAVRFTRERLFDES